MTITEAARQAQQLIKDPSTATAASMIGWEHPISRAEIVLADIFDLVHNALAEGRVDPHWIRPAKPRAPREVDQAAVDAALRLTGHVVG